MTTKTCSIDAPNICLHRAMPHNRWRTPALVVAGSLAVVLGLFRETAWSIVLQWWRYDTYSYGFLIFPCSLYLVWARRHRVTSLQPAPNPWALGLLAVLGLGWLLADLALVQVVMQVALVGMLPALVWAVLGTSVTRRLAFPLSFLFFAAPIGDQLVPMLQNFTASFAVKLLALCGVPVILEGNYISVPSGDWQVTAACSGIKYLITSMVLACLYAHITYKSWRRRISFFFAAVAATILANGLRAFGIILLGHLTANKIAVGVDHLIYGVVFFGVVMFLLFAVGSRWREHSSIQSAGADQGSGSEGPLTVESEQGIGRRSFSAKIPALFAASGIAVLALALLSARVLASRSANQTPPEVSAFSVLPPWKQLDSYTGRWSPRFLGATFELTQTYTSGPQQVHLYLAYYAAERQGAKLVSSMNVLYDGKRWVRTAEGSTTSMVDGRSLSVHETTIRSSGTTRLVWSWFWVDGRFTANPYWAKLLRVKASLFGRPAGSALIAVAADYAPDRAGAVKALQDFLGHASLPVWMNQTSRD